MNKTCIWEAQGNGHYLTACGKLIRDIGRYNKIMNNYYGTNKPEIENIKVCPGCGKDVKA